METIGFIGLGNMGHGMANNIQKAGYPMVVHDLREGATKQFLEHGAKLASSPAEVAKLSQVIFSSLPGPKEVELVATGKDGVLQGIRADCVYIELSTSRPTLIRQLEPQFQDKGAHLIDAPVSGGKSGAESGNLAIMVGGNHDIYQRVKPILDSFGDKVFYAGEIGAGSIAKLAHNMIGHGVALAIAEGLTLGVKAGVDPKLLWECIRRGAIGRMGSLHERIPRTVFPDKYEPANFALSLARKDIGLATELGKEFNVPMPLANLAEQFAIEAMNRGWADMDNSVIFRLVEEAADVAVRADGVDPAKSAQFISTHPETQI